MGAGKLRTHADRHPAAGHARRAGRHGVRLRRDAGLVRRRLRARACPAAIYVITTAIWEATLSFPPDYGRASAMGIALFVGHVRHADLLSLRSCAAAASRRSPARRSGRGRWTWAAWPGCCSPSAAPISCVAVVLPLAALLLTSFQRFATVILSQSEFTLANYQTALRLGRGAHGADQQPDAGLRRRHRRRCW